MIKPVFYFYHNKFQELSNKALDSLIDSWDQEGVEKDISLFKNKKYKEKSLSYLMKANKQLKQ